MDRKSLKPKFKNNSFKNKNVREKVQKVNEGSDGMSRDALTRQSRMTSGS